METTPIESAVVEKHAQSPGARDSAGFDVDARTRTNTSAVMIRTLCIRPDANDFNRKSIERLAPLRPASRSASADRRNVRLFPTLSPSSAAEPKSTSSHTEHFSWPKSAAEPKSRENIGRLGQCRRHIWTHTQTARHSDTLTRFSDSSSRVPSSAPGARRLEKEFVPKIVSPRLPLSQPIQLESVRSEATFT